MTATEKKTDAILTSNLAAQINEHHRYPLLVPGHSAFCHINVNNFLIYIVSESDKHPGYWYLADMVNETVSCRPARPQGFHEALRQDLRISGLPLILRWELLPVEYLFDGAAA